MKILIIIFLLSNLCIYSQTTIKGLVKSSDNTEIENAFVIIYNNTNDNLIEYVSSDENGYFVFTKKFDTNIYRIETSRIGFKKNIQKIAIGTDDDKIVDLKIVLEIAESSILKEVVVTSQRPIIVKKDTIIYDISHFTKKHDESLEEVLAKIEGFKINPNGDIEVNGKTIRKVLIDGKEVSDFGGGLLTKSISPEKVKSVEVRFDEKNNNIKESLLDGEKFVILDIKLKDDVKKSLFGKQQFILGYQKNSKIGGLSNLFSLNKKINIQFFAENNNFGKNNIRLNQIKNIGDEAKAKMFSLPVDIDDIKKRNGYQEEIYGFDNYISNDNSILGLSVNLVINDKTDLYFGSFNNYQFLKNSFTNELFFEQNLITNLNSKGYNRDVNSKNKIQLKHTNSKLKINSDFNYVFTNNLNNTLVNNSNFNDYQVEQNNNDLFFNNSIEYAFSDKLGVTSNFSYSKENYIIYNNLSTNNSAILDYLELNNDVFFQSNKNNYSLLNNSLYFTYRAGVFGIHSFGFKQLNQMLDNQKESNVNSFNTFEVNTFEAKQNSLTHKILLPFDKFNFSLLSEYTFFEFPSLFEGIYNKKKKEYYQYDFNATYDINVSTNLTFIFNNKLDYFPLQKTTFGNYLFDFQTIFIPNQAINPYYNKTLSLVYNKVFKNKKEIEIAYLNGISNNLNNQSFNNGLFFLESNQLKSSYHAFSTIYKHKFKKTPLQAVVEPEFLINTSEFITNNKIETTSSNRYLLGLKLNYSLNKSVSINYFPKYSYFVFSNSQSNNNRVFNFLSNTINLKLFFIEQKLMLNLNHKQVNFFQTKTNFNNFDFNIVYKNAKTRYFIEVSNIFNSNNFTTQELNQNILNINNNSVFSRYVNFGFEFKIN